MQNCCVVKITAIIVGKVQKSSRKTQKVLNKICKMVYNEVKVKPCYIFCVKETHVLPVKST